MKNELKHIYIVILLFICNTATAQALEAQLIKLTPYGFFNAENEIDGIHIDIVKKLEGHLNQNIPARLIPYRRIIRTFDESNDVWTIMAVNPGIENAAHSVLKIHELEVEFWAKPGFLLEDQKMLFGHSIARVQGTNLYPTFLGDRRIDVVDVKDTVMQLQMIASERLDALIATQAALHYTLKYAAPSLKSRLLNISRLHALKVDVAAYVPKHRANHPETQRLRAALSEMVANRDIYRFFNKYQLPELSRAAPKE